MKLFFTLLAGCLLLFAMPLQAQPNLSLTLVISGLSQPMQLVHPGDGTNRIFIVLKSGTILVYNRAYQLQGTFLAITSGITTSGEQGLLSLAFHPDYRNNGLFYVYYSNGIGDLELARYHVSNDPNVADDQSKVILKTISHQAAANHNGGELHFGKDGYLYLSTGDGGGAGDPPNNAQTTSILLGKILRFAVNTSNVAPYYTIPAGNPFGTEVLAYGLRNPFRWSFDRVTYDMWIGDVGQDSWEEINYRHRDSLAGVNYGWRCYEGNVPQDLSVGCTGPATDYVWPIHTYPTPSPGAVTGGTVYRGNTYIAFRGYYVGADFYSGTWYKIKYDSISHTATTTTQVISPTGLSDFGETEDGELFAVSLTSGAVYRIKSDGAIGYTFTGDGNWDVATNWMNEVIPPSTLPAGAEIIIDPVTNGECILNVPQTVSSGAKITVQSNKKFRVNGNLTVQ